MKRGSPLFRLLLFIAGCLLIILGRFLVPIPFAQDWGLDFAWISAFLIYLVWTLPFVLASFSLKTADSLAAGSAVYFRGAGLYTVLSGTLIGLVLAGVCPRPWAIPALLVIVFLFLIYLYLTLLTGGHIRAVQNDETAKAAQLNMIKGFSADILTVSEAAGDLSPQLKQRIGSVASELRYVSPSDAPYAHDLEQQIADLLHTLSAQISGGVRDEGRITQVLDQLSLTIQRRKNTN